MKFSTVFTAFVVVLPLFSGQALGAAQGNKGNGKFGKGSKGVPPPPANNNTASNNSTVSNNTTVSNNSTASNNATSNNAAANNNGGDPQTSTTLDPTVINTGSQQTGQNPPVAGQADSLTSNNNFINNCVGKTVTDGLQIKTGSCNTTPMGDIPSVDNMPAVAFASPLNGQDLAANQTFDIVLGTSGMQTGAFTNADKTYFAAPQQLNAAGQIVGHNHITCSPLNALADTTIPNPKTFSFFKGLNGAAVNGKLTATVTGGLGPGFYRCCSITTTANHVSVAGPVAQRGSFEDCVRFSVGQGNGANGNNGNGTPAGNGGNNNSAGTPGSNNSTGTPGGNNSTSTPSGNNSTSTPSGNNSTSTPSVNNSTGTPGGNNKNAGKNGGNTKNGGNVNRKGAGGRRRMVARLSRDH